VNDSPTLTTWRIGKHGLVPEPYDKADPRGLLLAWEPPYETCDYSVGVDPTVGIMGWNRLTRTSEDYKHDNAAIEVFRVGAWKNGVKQPDVQVAEWAGPVDAESDLPHIANFIGRLYGGSHEDKQALMTIEVVPGPGWMTQRVMHSQLGYERFLPWLVEGNRMVMRDTGKRGWYSNQSTRRDLWVRSGGHIKRRKCILHSTHFVEEMVLCTPDNFIALTAAATRLGRSGLNDDRVVAGMLALWAANEWQIGADATEPTPVVNTAEIDLQNSDASYEQMMERWNDYVESL
jgi:hypothetical protein